MTNQHVLPRNFGTGTARYLGRCECVVSLAATSMFGPMLGRSATGPIDQLAHLAARMITGL